MDIQKLSLATFLLAIGALAAPPLPAAGIDTMYTHGSFETLGVIVHLSADADGDETATLEYRVAGDPGWRQAHALVKYDGENMAGSIFGVTPATDYELRITLSDPDGVGGANPQTTNVTTAANFSLPAPQAILTVGPSGANFTTIQAALNAAQPGDEIRVAAGVYGPVSVSNLNPPAGSPVVVRAENASNRPVIDGNGQGNALSLSQSSNVVFDGFEIRNGGANSSGAGVRFQASSHLAIRNSLIHDNGRYEILVTQSAQYNGGTVAGGYHLIENNEIADLSYGACGGSINSACTNQTYYGIRLDNNAGAGTVIRNNTIYDHVDNAAICGDESSGRTMPESSRNVLALTGGTQNQGWTNHNLDVYDNVMYDARDDNIEADGICVNARIYRNSLGAAQNVISVAPALPGPYFIVRNLLEGTGEASIKFNTAAGPTSSTSVPAIRNIFFYHNTVARANQGTVLNLWYSVANDHNVPIKNIVFRNNVFWATAGGALINSNNQGIEHPGFDYDLWYTQTNGNIFAWWSGSQTVSAQNFAEFQQISGQEDHGFFGAPGLDSGLHPLPGGASQVVDRGMLLPGINDVFAGSAPDLGAFELGSGGGGSAGTLQFSQASFSANENAGSAVLSVTRSGGNSGSVSVNYGVTGGSATTGSDFSLSAGTLNWSNGDFGTKSIVVTLINDSTSENQETVTVALSNPGGGATIGATSSTTLEIFDDDGGSGGGGGGGGGGSSGNGSGGGSLDIVLALILLLMSLHALHRRQPGLRRRV